MSDDNILMDQHETAKYLNVPLLAIGQVIFDNRLTPVDGCLKFYLNEVADLLHEDPEYVKSLR